MNIELRIKGEDELASEDDLSIESEDIEVSKSEEDIIKLSLDR